MRSISTIFLLFAFIFKMKAGDSTKVKTPKTTLEIAYGRAMTGVHAIKDLYPSTTFGQPKDSYYTSDGNNVSCNLNLNLTPKSLKRQLYFNIGGNYSDFRFYHKKEDSYSGGHGSGTNYSYSPYNFKYTVRLIGLEVGLDYLRWHGNLLVDQKLGVSVVYVHNDPKEYSYDETTSSWGYLTDPAYVTASNPSGYYLSESTSTRTIVNGESSYNFNDYITPYYSLGFGYKIKRVIPFVSGQISMFEMLFWEPFIKYQAGIKILL